MIDNQLIRVLRFPNGILVSTLMFVVFLASTGCGGNAQKVDNEIVEKRYFDLAGFVSKQIAEMNSNTSLCKKLVSVNGKTEEKEIGMSELTEALEAFADADINKPAWSDKYSIDSVQANGLLKELRYLTSDKKLKTKELAVTFSEGTNVSEIYVRSEVRSVIADTYNDMYLWPGKGYEISTVQAVALSDTTHLRVKVICPN